MVDRVIEGIENLDVSGGNSPPPLIPSHHKKKHVHAYHNLYGAGAINPANLIDTNPGYMESGGGGIEPNNDINGVPFIPADMGVNGESQFQSSYQSQFQSQFQSQPSDIYAVNTSPNIGTQLGPEPNQQSEKSIRSFKNVNSVPSIVEDREVAQQLLGPEPVFKTFQHPSPPPAATDYQVLDQGVSGPNFSRLTMYNVPATEQLREITKLPLGMIIKPFASDLIPISDFTNMEPPRCRRCRTYINPSMIFTEGGTKFVCNMCQFANYVNGDYFQPIDASNRRIDWEERPELALGTYDIAVGQDYWKEEGIEPSCLKQLFLIDVSQESMKKNLPKLAAEAIRSVLYEERENDNNEKNTGEKNTNDDINDNTDSGDENISIGYLPKGCKIAIATFDKSIHFYNLNPALEQPQMIVMNEVNDPFVPIEIGLFVDPIESQVVIEQLLDRIDLLFEQTYNSEIALGAALEVGLQALKSTGGKVTAIINCLPTIGPGHLHFRETSQKSLEAEKELYKPSSQYYIDLGKNYAKAGIGLDFFISPTTFIDIANIGQVSNKSGGHIHYFPHFVPERDGKRFIAELIRSVSVETGFQAQLKVRCSNGLQVAAYYGNMYQQHDCQDDPVFGIVDSRSTIGVLFTYDGKLDTKLDAHFQAALLYTASNGERRVRVTNIVTSVTEQFKPLMNYVDIDSCMGIITREIITRIIESPKPLKEIRLQLQDRIVEVFSQYRKYAGAVLAPTLLLMPVSLRGFIINCLALQKSRALRDSTYISTDSRINTISAINSMDADELSLYLYPRIIGLHNLRSTDCEYNEKSFNMPINARASTSFLEEGGAYLLYNGQSLILWLHQLVSPLLLQDLFNVSNLQSINPYMNELPELNTEISRQTRSLIEYFATKAKLTFLGLQIARQGLDGSELEFMAQMVEDRIFDCPKYSDYVTFVHRQSRVTTDK